MSSPSPEIAREEQKALLERTKKVHSRFLLRLLKRTKKQLEITKLNHQQALQWPALYHEGLLLQTYFYQLVKGLSQIHLPDWQQDNRKQLIVLDPLAEPTQIIAKRFKQSKKLKASLPYSEKRIEELAKKVQEQQHLLEHVQLATTLEQLQLLTTPSTQKKSLKVVQTQANLPYREFLTEKGYKIWVGKNAKSNDQLTFSYAKGLDWWFHVKGYAGSHVILKVPKQQEPDQDAIQDAILLAILYSKGKDKGKVEVCVTQCKFVSKLAKSSAGKVQISKHKLYYAEYKEERFKQLKERQKSPLQS